MLIQTAVTDNQILPLVLGCQRGETAAVEGLYTLYADRIYRYLLARTGDPHTAEDLTGELFARMYGDVPDLWDPALAGYERLRFTTNCLTRLRVVDEEGRLRLKFKGELDKLPAGLVPWFRAPGRRTRGERVVCGHWSALGYRDEEGVLALDTGCVWGGSLTAQRIDGADTRVSVPSIDGGLPITGD
jgi:bis(5'-nucleosyl)-tetraphosphatase (symmetrical)